MLLTNIGQSRDRPYLGQASLGLAIAQTNQACRLLGQAISLIFQPILGLKQAKQLTQTSKSSIIIQFTILHEFQLTLKAIQEFYSPKPFGSLAQKDAACRWLESSFTFHLLQTYFTSLCTIKYILHILDTLHKTYMHCQSTLHLYLSLNSSISQPLHFTCKRHLSSYQTETLWDQYASWSYDGDENQR